MSYHDPGTLYPERVYQGFVVPKKKTLEQALAEGVSQLDSMGYEAELLASGAGVAHALAVALDGKEVRVRAAGDEGGRRAPRGHTLICRRRFPYRSPTGCPRRR
ncbi:MAG: hypothetical protein U0359_05755 [Byssovorax sp.]